MEIKTAVSCGDMIFVCHEGIVQQLTVGRITVQVTDSQGDDDQMFDNFKSQKGYEENYMCTETGIGSGYVYELGKTAFLSRDECAKANEEAIAQRRRDVEERAERNRRALLARESSLRGELAEIEKLKQAA